MRWRPFCLDMTRDRLCISPLFEFTESRGLSPDSTDTGFPVDQGCGVATCQSTGCFSGAPSSTLHPCSAACFHTNVPRSQRHKTMLNIGRWWARQDSNLGPGGYELYQDDCCVLADFDLHIEGACYGMCQRHTHRSCCICSIRRPRFLVLLSVSLTGNVLPADSSSPSR